MGLCVAINPDGTLTPTGQPVSECSAYVLVSGSEYSLLGTIEQLLGNPTEAQVAIVLGCCFFGPIALYLVAHMGSKIARVFG